MSDRLSALREALSRVASRPPSTPLALARFLRIDVHLHQTIPVAVVADERGCFIAVPASADELQARILRGVAHVLLIRAGQPHGANDVAPLAAVLAQSTRPSVASTARMRKDAGLGRKVARSR